MNFQIDMDIMDKKLPGPRIPFQQGVEGDIVWSLQYISKPTLHVSLLSGEAGISTIWSIVLT